MRKLVIGVAALGLLALMWVLLTSPTAQHRAGVPADRAGDRVSLGADRPTGWAAARPGPVSRPAAPSLELVPPTYGLIRGDRRPEESVADYSKRLAVLDGADRFFAAADLSPAQKQELIDRLGTIQDGYLKAQSMLEQRELEAAARGDELPEPLDVTLLAHSRGQVENQASEVLTDQQMQLFRQHWPDLYLFAGTLERAQ